MDSRDVSFDWRRLVREKLELSQADGCKADEIIAELASHIEESYEQHRERGLAESRALEAALEEVSDWRQLRSNIRHARLQEDEMNQRTRAIWIPALASVAVASGDLAMLQVWGVRPHIVWMRSGFGLLFYIPWLVAQPVFGAAGAYLSRRLGGSRAERLIAGIFPSIAMLLTFCVGLVAAIVESFWGITHLSHFTLIGLGLYIGLWVLVPGAALAAGALPFLGEQRAVEAH